MKCRDINNLEFYMLLLLSITLNTNSCCPRDVDSRLMGKWQTAKSIITVRVEVDRMKFEFTKDTAIATITINKDLTVNGKIGSAEIENGVINVNKNLLPPSITGVAYKIKCDLSGKIFENDPLEAKKVQFWIYPIEVDNRITAELRYTEGGAQFPMAGFSFAKVDD